MLKPYLISPVRATRPVNRIILDLISQIQFVNGTNFVASHYLIFCPLLRPFMLKYPP